MSLVIAVKDKDRVVIGADKQLSTDSIKEHTTTKIWEAHDLPGVIFGGVGSVRASQIIQYANIIDKNSLGTDFSTEFIIHSVVPSIINTLEANGISCLVSQDGTERSYMPNAFIIAYGSNAWAIWNDLSVIEINEYFAIGSGSDVAKGALFATIDKNPFERIVTSIDAAAITTLFVDDGIDLLATKYYPKDKVQIVNALGVTTDNNQKQDEVALKNKNKKKL